MTKLKKNCSSQQAGSRVCACMLEKKQNWEYSQVPLSEEAGSPTAGHRSLPGLPPPPHTAPAWQVGGVSTPQSLSMPAAWQGGSPVSPAHGHRAHSASTGHEGKEDMFPVSLPKGRFPSSLPSLKPSLGFPSMAEATVSVRATHASDVSWLGTGTRQGQQHWLHRQRVHPYPDTSRCAQEWLPSALEQHMPRIGRFMTRPRL